MKLRKLLISIVVVSLIVSMAIPLVAAPKPPKPPPEEPPADPVIAYISEGSRKEPGGVAVMNADGERQTVIFSEGDRCQSPTWSHDGSSIAFRQVGTSGWEIWAMDVDVVDDEPQGSNLRMLADANAFEGGYGKAPQWSPAGDVIAVHGYWASGNDGIYLIPVEGIPPGGSAEKIYVPEGENDRAVYHAWNPDGTQMAFWYGDRSGESVVVSIKILDLTMSPPQVVNTLIEGEFTNDVGYLDWGRTNNKLAFTGVPSDGGEKSLYTLDIGSGILTLITAANDHPSWSPDDSHIMFNREGSGRGKDKTPGGLHSIELATGDITFLVEGWSSDWKR